MCRWEKIRAQNRNVPDDGWTVTDGGEEAKRWRRGGPQSTGLRYGDEIFGIVSGSMNYRYGLGQRASKVDVEAKSNGEPAVSTEKVDEDDVDMLVLDAKTGEWTPS